MMFTKLVSFFKFTATPVLPSRSRRSLMRATIKRFEKIFRPVLTYYILSAALVMAACQNQQASAPHLSAHNVNIASEDDIPHAQLGANIEPLAYRLDMRIDPDLAGYSGIVEIDVDIKTATDKVWLHSKHMTVTEAVAILPSGPRALEFTELSAIEAPSGIAYITAADPLPAGRATLRLPFETPFNLALNSAYKVERGDEAYIITQFEPLGAREAFPSFDESRFKVPFTLSITSPSDDVVYANTPKLSTQAQEDGWIKHAFQTTRPLPTYLIAFGVGPFDVVEYDPLPPTALRKRPVPLRGITAKGLGDQILYGLKHTAGILEAIENYFGIPYPYEKIDLIAAPDYAFGAMENPGAIVYREFLMLMDEVAPLSQKRAYARVHSHELAHQWFGNLVTPVWWEDIWLNEAFATWMGNKGTALWRPDGNYDRITLNAALDAMSIDTLATTRKVREPLLRSENVMDQFDGITYRKGGGVLSMFESYLGEDRFREGVRLHMERYADGVATGDDFFQSIADGSEDENIVDAMKSFVDQPGLPLVSAKPMCNAPEAQMGPDAQTEKVTQFALQQSRYAPLGSKTRQGQIWQIPVCARVGYGEITRKHCTLMTEETQLYTPESYNDACADWVMPNADGAGYYRFALDKENWDVLLKNIDKLNTREVLTLQDSLFAGFRAGDVNSETIIKGMQAFARHPEYDVAQGAGGVLDFIGAHIEAPDDLARLVQTLYKTRYAESLGQDTVDGNLLVPSMAAHLVSYGRDTGLEAQFAKQGADYLGLDGDAKRTTVAPNLLVHALEAVMRARGDAAYGRLMDLVKSGSSFEKSAAVRALAAVPTPALADRLRAAVLSDTETLTGRQAMRVITGLMGSENEGAATWTWLTQNFVEFVTLRVPDVRKGGLPALGGLFCSPEQREDVRRLFTDHADFIPGYERSLAQTLESIELCTALKTEKSDEMIQALKAH